MLGVKGEVSKIFKILLITHQIKAPLISGKQKPGFLPNKDIYPQRSGPDEHPAVLLGDVPKVPYPCGLLPAVILFPCYEGIMQAIPHHRYSICLLIYHLPIYLSIYLCLTLGAWQYIQFNFL